MPSNRNFYKNIPAVESFQKIFTEANYLPAPDDWFVVITDVVSSTTAIEAGRYKDVNVAGGLSTMAICNAFNDMEIPFVFGGDGVTLMVPGEIAPLVSDVLFDTAEKVGRLFELNLRVGMVSVAELRRMGKDITVGKMLVSKYYNQAILRGDGLDFAEALVKSESQPNAYLIKEKKDKSVEADFRGFTCRWQDIPSTLGETIALIIRPREEQQAARTEIYTTVFDTIHSIYGSPEDYHPLREEAIKPAKTKDLLGREGKAISGQTSGFRFQMTMLHIRLETIVTRLAMTLRLPLKAFWYNLKDLKKYQIISCDFQKYDGTIKMVIAGSKEAREKLMPFLEQLYRDNKIFFGLHASDRAVMTCLLHANSKREVHFVDAADGGYAYASKRMKEQMKKHAPTTISAAPESAA